VDQPILRRITRDRGFEDVGVADALDATQSALALHAVDGRLHGGVGRALGFRECFLDFADGTRAASPKDFHDLQFELGEFGWHLTIDAIKPTIDIVSLQQPFAWALSLRSEWGRPLVCAGRPRPANAVEGSSICRTQPGRPGAGCGRGVL